MPDDDFPLRAWDFAPWMVDINPFVKPATQTNWSDVTNTLNVLSEISGVVVSKTGKKRLLLKMATKNASSSAYYGAFTWARFMMTSQTIPLGA